MAYNTAKRVGTNYGTAIDSGTKSSEVLLDFDSLNLWVTTYNLCCNNNIFVLIIRNPKLLKGISDMGLVLLNDLQKILLPELLLAIE